MERVEERALIDTTEWALHSYHQTRRISAADLCDLHRRWLSGIYSWAGSYRSVNVSKAGFMFAAAAQVPRLMEEFERKCLARHTPLRGSNYDVRYALAETHTELLLIHPFREGNGRTARLLAKLMALQAEVRIVGFETFVERRREEYFAAVRAGLDRNYNPMRDLFSDLIDVRRS